MVTQAQPDDFDVGKAIFDKLKDLPPDRQLRVLRWVAEGLGIPLDVTRAQPTGIADARREALTDPARVPVGAGTDIKSFVASKAPKSDNQFATAVAYFYRFEAPPADRRNSIDGTTLQEAARLAGRNRLSDPNKTLNNAKAAGYLDGATAGEFAINSVGENLVAMTLPGGAPAPVRQAKKKHRSTASKSKPKKG